MRAFIKPMSHLAGMSTGWGNGYVVIPEGHPLHGKPYDDIDVQVHGGLTFAEPVDELDWEEIIEADKGGWVVGFDTAHYADGPGNWPKGAVQKEADELMDQLVNYKVTAP